MTKLNKRTTCKTAFVRWRHFTTTTTTSSSRIHFGFAFMCTFANPKEVQKPKALICTRKQNREGFSLMSRNKSNGENGEKSPEGWRYPEQPLSKGPFAIFSNNLAIVRHFCFLLRHRQRVHFWTYPRILTVLVK